MVVMDDVDIAVERIIMDNAARLRIQIDTIGAVREGLDTISQHIFFSIIHFVDQAIAKSTDFYCRNVTDVEIGMQRRGGFKFTVGFQFHFTGGTYFETGQQAELVRP